MPCQSQIATMAIYAGGPKFQANILVRPAFTLLGGVFMKFGYIVRRIGAYNCRKITGGTTHSSHSWGISVDVNDDTNPYRKDKLVTDMSDAMIQAIYNIKTFDGVQVFRWGGDWDGRPHTRNSNYDAMHIECVATPDELDMGFDLPAVVGKVITDFPVIRRGAEGDVVSYLQGLLAIKKDGAFGSTTQTAVIKYQKSRGLIADGIVGFGTWTALITKQPTGVSPIKGSL